MLCAAIHNRKHVHHEWLRLTVAILTGDDQERYATQEHPPDFGSSAEPRIFFANRDTKTACRILTFT
jgi:hypothetical protein